MTRGLLIVLLLTVVGCVNAKSHEERKADDVARARAALEEEVAFAATRRFMAMNINVDLDGTDLADVMEQIARQVGTTIVVDPAVRETVTISIRDRHWREVVSVIAEGSGCVAEDGPGGVTVRYR